MPDNQSLGKAGEAAAADFLESHGYLIVERNVAMRKGEIDIVARESGDLVFLEVKTRSSDRCGLPEEAITAGKARNLAQAAREYIYANLLDEESVRCDVVAVLMRPNQDPEIAVHRDAIELGSMLEP